MERIEGYLQRAQEVVGEGVEGLLEEAADLAVPAEFAAALDDDLNVPEALAVLFSTVREGNRALEQPEGTDIGGVRHTLLSVLAMGNVLGINPLDPTWGAGGATGGSDDVLEALVQERLAARATARAERDFATSDSIRDHLAAIGIIIEDTPAGARWSLAR